ncbi:MAG TPA: DUF4013 domain-containing protein [Thermoflexia bacterium]|nr:DUF4013 domain-containing protein [Thermoflexia bacterium]
MTGQIEVSSLKDVFRFPFRRPDWPVPFLIGSALVFAGFWIPLVPWIFVAGYLVWIMRRVIEGEAPSLPDWRDWGALARDGLKATGIGLVYLLPGILVYLAGIAFYLLVSVVAPFAAEGGGGEEGWFLLLVMFAMVVFLLSLFLGTLLFFVGLVPLPVAMAEFAASGDFAAAFRLRRLWEVIRVDGWGYFVAWVVLFGLGAIAYVAMMLVYYSGVFCCLAPLAMAPVAFYLWLVGAALFGQMCRESVGLLGGA